MSKQRVVQRVAMRQLRTLLLTAKSELRHRLDLFDGIGWDDETRSIAKQLDGLAERTYQKYKEVELDRTS